MKTLVKTMVVTSVALISFSSAVSASPYLTRNRIAPMPPVAAELVDTRPEMAPIAFVRFCMDQSDQCRGASDVTRLTLVPALWEQIREVNASINAKIAPDAQKGGYDWSLEATSGNCNDYAVQKRKALLDLGFPVSALALAVVVTGSGVGHLVLTIRTDRGDYVLDNLRPNIVAWNQTGYRWLKRQSAEDPQNWVAVSTETVRQVASIAPMPRAKALGLRLGPASAPPALLQDEPEQGAMQERSEAGAADSDAPDNNYGLRLIVVPDA